jgi:hypothetical protein
MELGNVKVFLDSQINEDCFIIMEYRKTLLKLLNSVACMTLVLSEIEKI